MEGACQIEQACQMEEGPSRVEQTWSSLELLGGAAAALLGGRSPAQSKHPQNVTPRLHYRLLTLCPGASSGPGARGKKRLLSVMLLSVFPLRLAPHPASPPCSRLTIGVYSIYLWRVDTEAPGKEGSERRRGREYGSCKHAQNARAHTRTHARARAHTHTGLAVLTRYSAR